MKKTEWHNSVFNQHLHIKNNSSIRKVCCKISREVNSNIKGQLKLEVCYCSLETVFENLNTMHIKLDLISAKLCFDTAFSLSWLQSKSCYSSVMLMPAGESEWGIWKSDGWTWVESIGHAWGGLGDEEMGDLKG